MKLGERKKIETILQRIQSNSFDDIDVDTLFSRLRDYASPDSALREVGHYLAHNRERNQGITTQELSSFWLTVRFYVEYHQKKRHIDVYNLPLWIKEYILFQAKRLDQTMLQSDLGMSGKRLTDRIKSKFKDHKSLGITKYRHPTVSEKDAKLINYLLMKILIKPVFDVDDVFEDLITILKKLNLNFDISLLSKQRDKISLCIMYIVDNTTFILSDNSKAECNITSEKHPSTGEPCICISGSMRFTWEEDAGISFVLLSSRLNTKDWLDTELLNEEQSNIERYQTVYLIDVFINSDFKLTRHR